MRLHWMQNEKAAVVYLRKNKHYSITQLEAVFGRSRSLISKIIKFNTTIGAIPHLVKINILLIPNKQSENGKQ